MRVWSTAEQGDQKYKRRPPAARMQRWTWLQVCGMPIQTGRTGSPTVSGRTPSGCTSKSAIAVALRISLSVAMTGFDLICDFSFMLPIPRALVVCCPIEGIEQSLTCRYCYPCSQHNCPYPIYVAACRVQFCRNDQLSPVMKVIYRIKQVSMTHIPERLASQRALVKIVIAANHDVLC